LFFITIIQTNFELGVKKNSTLVLVDLAGSEKVSKTGATGLTLLQAQHTNKSLATLGLVIKSLTENYSHIPYRDSKLTRLLTDSLGGNSKTCLIITCSLDAYNFEETISTLRFGMRVKTIKNKPKINAEITIEEYKKLLQAAYETIRLLERKSGLNAETNKEIKEMSIGTADNLNEELEKAIDSLSNNIGDKEKEINELIDNIEHLTLELEKYRKENQVLNQEINIKNNEITINKENKTEVYLKRMVDSKAKMVNILEEENIRMRNDMQKIMIGYEKRFEIMKIHISQLQKELDN